MFTRAPERGEAEDRGDQDDGKHAGGRARDKTHTRKRARNQVTKKSARKEG